MSSAAAEWLDSLQSSGIRPGLGRIRALLRTLGKPQLSCPAIIVAGTNGKGSTSATLASILNESGYRVGFYSSPHLVDIRERWQIAGKMIEPELLDAAIEDLQRAAVRIGITPTYFEALTIIAFIAFARAGCELMVLEVGMGGRLDATNVVKPIAAVITPVGLDHTDFLGKTLRRIASEKAGVIHRGAVVLTSNDDPAVLNVLRRRAAKFGNAFIHVMDEHATPLPGWFQRRNAGLAVAAARALAGTLPRITEASIERGVAGTRWRGRLEHFRLRGKEIWIDGAHNGHAVDAIAPFLEAMVARPRILVFGVMSDKDIDPLTGRLFPLFDRIITTEPYPPRSASAQSLAERGQAVGVTSVAELQPEAALRLALEGSEPAIVVAGSLYLAGAAVAFFDALQQRRSGQQ